MKTMEAKQTKRISRRFRRFLGADEAVSALEYAILVGVIAVAIAAALAIFGADLSTGIQSIGDAISSPGPTNLDL